MKWIWWSNPKDSPKKIALIRTLQVHCLLLLLTLGYNGSKPKALPPIRMKTHTVHMPITKPVVQKKAAPIVKKGAQPVSKPAPKPFIQPKASPKQKPLDRIKQLDQSLEKLEKALKNPPKNLVIETDLTLSKSSMASSTNYETQLIQRLQAHLKLIDLDPVDVTITVQPNGIVASIQSIDSSSLLNSKIVEGALNRIVFPPFEGEQPMEFTLHLCTDTSPQ